MVLRGNHDLNKYLKQKLIYLKGFKICDSILLDILIGSKCTEIGNK